MTLLDQTSLMRCPTQMQVPDEPKIRTIFETCSIRCTRPRILIYSVLMGSRTHPTAEELHQQVRDIEPGISLATIYNTVELLVDHGLALKIASHSNGTGANRYDGNHIPHLHIVLTDGQVLDVPHDLSQRLMDSIPTNLLDELADHAGVNALKIEIVEDPNHAIF